MDSQLNFIGDGFYLINGIKTKITIVDTQVFKAIKPETLASYLEANHWEEVNRVEGELVILRKNNQHVWLPISDQFSDYAELVTRVVATVAKVENKSEFEILETIKH